MMIYAQRPDATACAEYDLWNEKMGRYVRWGGLTDAFDPDKESSSKEYAQLKELLTPEEYAAARGSTLNAHYTSPTVIKAIYEAVGLSLIHI